MYCLYFLGMSEISTSLLCVLACFDADHGVAALGTQLPALMKVGTLRYTFFHSSLTIYIDILCII